MNEMNGLKYEIYTRIHHKGWIHLRHAYAYLESP